MRKEHWCSTKVDIYIFTLWAKDAYVDGEPVTLMLMPQQAASSRQPGWEQFLG